MRIGLALSGGGFRATLFHLGVIHFLKRAGLLEKVSNVCAASGGSIVAGHLVQNWDSYTSDELGVTQRISEQLYRLAGYDVRGRILRRLMVRSRSSLFQRMLSRQLFSIERPDAVGSLAEADSSQPYLQILATNLTLPSCCTFGPDGYSMDGSIDGSSTSPMFWPSTVIPLSFAVAASAAFPAMFPPLLVTAEQLGIKGAHIPYPHRLTDGGVYDNLCMRKLQQLIDSQLAYARLRPAEVIPYSSLLARWQREAAPDSCERRIVEMTQRTARSMELTWPGCLEDQDLALNLLNRLLSRSDFAAHTTWKLIEDACEEGIKTEIRKLRAKSPRSLLHTVRLNRLLFDATANDRNHPTFRGQFDLVIVSDASQPLIEVNPHRRRGPFATALRAADVLFGQLAVEDRERMSRIRNHHHSDLQKYLVSIAEVTDCDPIDQDTQRRLPMVRTDLDRFDDTEICALVQHGYSVTRKTLSSLVHIAESEDPWLKPTSLRKGPIYAREMDRSIDRRWRLFSHRDPITYAHLFAAGMVLLFSCWTCRMIFDWRREYAGLKLAAASYFEENVPRHADELAKLYLEEPLACPTVPVKGEIHDQSEYAAPDYDGFSFISDLRVFDFRHWKPLDDATEWAQPHSPVVLRRTVRIKKVEDVSQLVLESRSTGKALTAVWRNGGSGGTVARYRLPGDIEVAQITINVEKIRVGREFDAIVEFVFWNAFQRPEQQWAGALIGDVAQHRVTLLLLAPPGTPFQNATRSISIPTEISSHGSPLAADDSGFRCESDIAGPQDISVNVHEQHGQWCYWEIWNPKRNLVYRIDWTFGGGETQHTLTGSTSDPRS